MRVLGIPLAVIMLVGLGSAPPAQAVTVPPALEIAEDFPDPDVVNVGGTWYAYATNGPRGQVPVASAASLDGPWTVRGDAMPRPGGWSDGWSRAGRTWAPDVHPAGTGLVLTYTAWHAASGRQCIGVASSTSPLGPFVPRLGRPLICPTGIGGAIDAATYIENGVRYLLYKNDGNAVGQDTWLWLQRVTTDGLGLIGSPVRLIRQDRPEEGGLIEAPVLVRRPSRYVLFYSAGFYGDGRYLTSYATSSSLTGPYTKAYRPLMTTASLDNAAVGPGGADVTANRIVFHGVIRPIEQGLQRGMYVAALGWANDYPVVRGSRVRYEAEGGRLNHCVVRTGAAGASQGAVVAYIDYPDSWFEVDVFAPVAGAYTVHIGYANGSPATATHTLTVNGGAPVTATYPVTGWDNWRQASVGVQLAAGFNRIRLAKGAWYAEVDYLEVA